MFFKGVGWNHQLVMIDVKLSLVGGLNDVWIFLFIPKMGGNETIKFDEKYCYMSGDLTTNYSCTWI